MTDAAHTPWEWTVVKSEGAVTEWTLTGPKTVLCRFWENALPRDEALLIAAAPDTAVERDRLVEVNAGLLKALDTIARGMTNEFPGGPDIMNVTPEEFRSAMWSWSQDVAHAAIKLAKKD